MGKNQEDSYVISTSKQIFIKLYKFDDDLCQANEQ